MYQTNEPVAVTDVLGVRISAVSLASATEVVMRWIQNLERQYVAVTGVHGVMEAHGDPYFKAILNNAGLCVPDGMPMVWLSKLAGYSHVTRVFGPDFMLEMSNELSKVNGRAFYYGGAPGVAEELAARMEHDYPGLVTAGSYCPPYRKLTEEERGHIITTINDAAPDVVWVGLSTPKQENWMAEFREVLVAPVLLGVGAAFDYNTGRIKRAPLLVQSSGFEWLYRMLQDPKRLFKRYAKNNPLFLYHILRHSLK